MHTLSFRLSEAYAKRMEKSNRIVWSTEGWLPLAKGAAEHSEAEGFAPTEMRSDFKNCCFQIILHYPLRANPPLGLLTQSVLLKRRKDSAVFGHRSG